MLIRYGELALKSPPVRREFERTLRRNILDQFMAARLACRLSSDRGHFYVECDDPAPAARLLRRVFGVTSVSPATEVETERAVLRERVIALADPLLRPGATFAVRARRTGSHPFTSQELARDLGSDLIERFGDRALKVDLDHPEVEVFVEVRGPKTYLYVERFSGPGGLPLGVAGQVVALVNGVRGALGAYLMMKRGCRCAVVTDPSGEPFGRDVLARFDPKLRIESADPSAVEPALRTLSESTHADGLVLPLSVEEYADAKGPWGDKVVFSPTVGFSDAEVSERWAAVASLVS